MFVYNQRMANKFSPRNKVQKLLHERKGFTAVQQFEKAMKAFDIPRTTARYWWDNGIPSTTTLRALQAIADFLGVSLDELRS